MARASVDAIRQVPLFAQLDEAELVRLADRFVERSFKEGDVVVEEGATGKSVIVIVDGSASVSIAGELKASLGPGDYFGEMAAMDDGIRSASIVAATDLDVCFLTPWEFRPFVEEHPEVAWKLLRSLARRLREAQSGQEA